MRRIALVASERREFDGLLRRFGPGEALQADVRFARRISHNDVEWLLFADGQGSRAAARACAAIPASGELFAVGSIGYCGGAKPRWQIGDVLLATEVTDGQSQECFSAWMPELSGDAIPMGRILTVDRVVRQASEKRRLGQTGVDAIEMEAATVARAARVLGASFFALKAVSDTCDEDLAFDFDRARRGDGSIRVGSVMAQALTRPWDRLPKLGQLARAARKASENLGVALAAIFPADGTSGMEEHGNS